MKIKHDFTTYNVAFELLTPLHIGSGRQLSKGIDFFVDHQENRIIKVSPETILSLIGGSNINGESNININKWTSNIDKWTNAISEGKDIFEELEFLKNRKKELIDKAYETLPLRIPGTEIKKDYYFEFIRNGLNANPVIPGSSIKGSLRTALLAGKVLKDGKFRQYFLKNIKALSKKGFVNKHERRKFENSIHQELNKKFQKNPNKKYSAQKDYFKCIQISDVEMNKENLFVDNFQTLNLNRDDEWYVTNRLTQTKECLSGNGVFRLKIDHRFWKDNPFGFKNLQDFIQNIKHHFIDLITKEYQNFKEEFEKNKFVNIKIGKRVVDNYSQIKNEMESLKENELIIRMSHGSGWDFMTGAWAKDESFLDDDEWKFLVENILRPNRKYEIMPPFPKTRRVTSAFQFPGFVKLKIFKS